MSGDVTQILTAIEQGDSSAVDQLLPLVYNELRRLASAKLAREKPGQTLQATALVHEVFLRLVGTEKPQQWNDRRHFFGAAAEAMRRILVESVRRKQRCKHGGDFCRREVELDGIAATVPDKDLLELSEAIDELSKHDPQSAELVKLRFFAGFSMEETARLVGLSRAAAHRHWIYARAWLFARVRGLPEKSLE
jgi:RNA polymerase sigma factor (TIGR02999 family)